MRGLDFQIFGIPVRVEPIFLFIAAYLAYGLAGSDLVRVALGVVLIFVAILAHELGHAAAGLYYGLRPRISLHGFGGLTAWGAGSRVTHGVNIVLSLGGPIVSLVCGVTALLVLYVLAEPESGFFSFVFFSWEPLIYLLGWQGSLKGFLLDTFIWVNLGWAIFNLMPVTPLDGGQVLRSTLGLVIPRQAATVAAVIALIVLGLIFAWLVKRTGTLPSLWNMLLLGLLASENIKVLSGSGREPH
ncbi:MAG: site-2 protease family protein [Myxococcota bacterium]